MAATFIQRLKAFLLDYMLILLYLGLVVVISVFIFPQIQQLFTHSPILSQLYGFLIVTLPITLYFVIMDCRLGGQSFGKRKLNIRVVAQSGQPLSVPHSLVRTVIKFTPWELSHFLIHRLTALGEQPVPVGTIMIGVLVYGSIFTFILTAIFSREKRALYDMIVRTRVVRA
ncbi:MAG: hypothetical protein K0R67_3169 [Paenibacillus sp.]|nr:hypothetical protein [Paenibacillus sp.]